MNNIDHVSRQHVESQKSFDAWIVLIRAMYDTLDQLKAQPATPEVAAEMKRILAEVNVAYDRLYEAEALVRKYSSKFSELRAEELAA